MKIEARLNNAHIKQPCATCGTWDRPGDVAYFDENGDWVCGQCVEGGPERVREGLASKAEYYREVAREAAEASAGPIEIMPPSPEVLDELRRIERESALAREEFERRSRKARMAGDWSDLPF